MYIYVTNKTKTIMKTTDTIQKFILEIPYSNASARNRAKKAGAKWNANEKVWEIETTMYQLDNVRNLASFIKK